MFKFLNFMLKIKLNIKLKLFFLILEIKFKNQS